MNLSLNKREFPSELSELIERNEPLDKHSRIRTGGEASIWAEPGELNELIEIWRFAQKISRELDVVGLGSNILFPDDGIAGSVCKLGKGFQACELLSQSDLTARVRLGAALPNALVVRKLHEFGLTGMEFLKLIPGTVGGTVAMNGGTKESEIADILEGVVLLSSRRREAETVPEFLDYDRISEFESLHFVDSEGLDLSYRSSNIGPGEIVVEAIIDVSRGDFSAAKKRMEKDKKRREETQPYRKPSVGSTFVNPDDDYAGRLIDEAGLKNEQVGGARVSSKHANFIINDDDASTSDVIELMAKIRAEVYEKFGMLLEPEVQFVGFDGYKTLEQMTRQKIGNG